MKRKKGEAGRLAKAQHFIDPVLFDKNVIAILKHNQVKFKDLLLPASPDEDWKIDQNVHDSMLSATEQLAGRLMQRASWFASYRSDKKKSKKLDLLLEDIEMGWKVLDMDSHQ